jgi:hypothetical protein
MVILKRFAYTPDGTFGKIYIGDQSWFTVERPWVNNAPFISCIPEGEYKLQWYTSPKFGTTLAVIGGTVSLFPDSKSKRSAILVHPANTMDDLQGCIGLGTSRGVVRNKWAVVNSGSAVTQFQNALKGLNNVNFSVTFTKEIAFP